MRRGWSFVLLLAACNGEPAPTYAGAHDAKKPAPKATAAAAPAPVVTAAPGTTTTAAPTAAGPATASDGPCKTTCGVDASSSLPPDETKKIATALVPMMRELKGCLARVGAQNIRPVVFARFGENGKAEMPRIDVGGYENLACVNDAKTKPIEATTSHGAIVRCEQRCD
jgi:hypothetical protein